MNNIKSYFWYNKRQRNGILFLLGIIVSLQFIFYLLPFSPGESENITMVEQLEFQRERDSLKELEIKKYEVEIYPFNPNFISDFKGYQLGMSPAEIDRLHQYRAQGKYINTISSFQEITSVSDSLLNRISPYFQFPIWKKNKTYKTKRKLPDQPLLVKKDLNTAKYDDLKLIQGIGDKLASRIINYRAKIQGFTFNDQLNEVWNLEEALVDRVLMYFEIKSAPVIEKININEASFKEVLSIPYIDYALTKEIFNFRDEVAEIQSVEELKKIDGFPLDKLSRIALYLEAK
jgi:DNA uptake protein ComE-like DNA-binding protein